MGYDISYMNNLIKALQGAFDNLNRPSLIKGGDLFLDNLPTLGYGLDSGFVFSDSGTLKIVRTQDIYIASFSFSVSTGTVSVST